MAREDWVIQKANGTVEKLSQEQFDAKYYISDGVVYGQPGPDTVIASDSGFQIRDTSPGAMYPWTVDRWYADAEPKPEWLPLARFMVKNDALDFLTMKATKP